MMDKEVTLVPGRLLFCHFCDEFQRMRVSLSGEPPDTRKVIECRVCGQELAWLQMWGDSEWIDDRFVENLAFTALTMLGVKSLSRKFVMKQDAEKQAETPLKQKKARTTNLSKIFKFGVAISATVLGAFHLVLTTVAIHWQVHVWPFTEIWNAFMWMGAETETLLGILVASVVVALGILGIILMKWRSRR